MQGKLAFVVAFALAFVVASEIGPGFSPDLQGHAQNGLIL